MVCDRCIMVVREHLEKAGLGPMEVTLGEAAFPLDLTGEKIAYRMDYSSVAYLNSQIKRLTGFTPSEFRKIKGEKRIAIDLI